MPQSEPSAYTELKEHLHEMFQLDRGDLDFGIYRIMNMKRHEIEEFLDNQLLPQVRSILESYRPGGLERFEYEMDDAEDNPNKYSQDHVERLDRILSYDIDVDKMEVEIYSDLYNFFRRYYSEGDFLSLRRYKEGVYALPYEGEEVKLHWANHDQYYIKTSENLKHYTFRVPDGRRVRFEINSGCTEKNNNKAANGKERRFILDAKEPVTIEGNQLTIRFEYRPDGAKRAQCKINEGVLKALMGKKDIADFGLSAPAPTDKKPERTLLEKHLTAYTAKFTFDYFIHKDLEGFLRRELDFYIKNEIMHLDDVENEVAPKVENYLAKIRAMRQVAGKIIQFLAQIEDFQKKLWLKKKFVLETNYCVTLDHIIGSEAEGELLPQVAANDEQREEWVRLFTIDELDGYSSPLTEDFLKANDKLQVDTRFFDLGFKYALLASIDDLDDAVDGVLINSENFQALQVLSEKYRQKIRCVYIDPPYNTDASPIMYKNGYRKSSWNGLVIDRLRVSKEMISGDGIFCGTIDSFQQSDFHKIIEDVFGHENLLGTVAIRNNPSGRPTPTGMAIAHEYGIFASRSSMGKIQKLPRTKEQDRRYSETDGVGAFMWELLRKRGTDSRREDARRSFFPFYFDGSRIWVPEMEWDESSKSWTINERVASGVEEIWPIDEEGVERRWRWGVETAREKLGEVRVAENGVGLSIYYKYRRPEGVAPTTNWIDSKYSATEHGTGLLKHYFEEYQPFQYPKSLYAVIDCLLVSGLGDKEAEVMDYFAGSGTTGHAVINLNRDDGGQRKYILVEMGGYFDTVTKPRVQKAAYSKDWKDGKPVSRQGVSHIIKYMSLEQYEDTLDNLRMVRTQEQTDLLDEHPEMREEYMLRYMMDIESRGSASLLDIDAFADPFAYGLDIMQDDEFKPMAVDLVETFNYLLGLTVKKVSRDPSGVAAVTGINSLNEECLILWRNAESMDRDALDAWFKEQYVDAGLGVDVVYVNGDNNIENLKPSDQHWEVRLTEAEFKRLMFDVQDV